MEESIESKKQKYKLKKLKKKEMKKQAVTKTKKMWELEVEEARDLQTRYCSIITDRIETFADFPLSKKTLSGLKAAGYSFPTEIQKSSIGPILLERDILGAAKTGSGKTLAFLIPILECLYRERWTAIDGLGVLIISPTRELAYQTFEVLYKIGKQHEFSAGLVIGGKDVEQEMGHITRTNIVVCTPGRLLQHLDTTANFECSNLKMLVLDEADRILDMGFQKTMNAILDHLPTTRQTLLFSATQTKSVKDLARLSLRDPKYVAVHEHHEHSTPAQLEQSYIVCELGQKLDILYSFVKAHKTQKILVFMASCKQVKYTFEMFCKLRPGTTVMALYGTLHQMRRVSIYDEFCKKESAILFATDIASRGLDFPAVHWVIQVDCPEDASTYIHRVGRTARYEKDGESLLFLLPSEEYSMVKQLNDKKIPIQKIEINPNKKLTIYRKLQSYCAQDTELKESGKRCFVSYVKSVYLMKDKTVFNVSKLALDNYSVSLGLPFTPRIRFLEKIEKRMQEQQKNKVQGEVHLEDTNKNPTEVSDSWGKDRILQSSSYQINEDDERYTRQGRNDMPVQIRPLSDNEDELDLLVMKKKDVFGVNKKDGEEGYGDDDDIYKELGKSKKVISKVAAIKKLSKMQINTKVKFDEDKIEKNNEEIEEVYEKGLDIQEAQKYMKEADEEDKILFRERIKAKHREERLSRRRSKKDMADEGSSDENEDEEGIQLDVGDDYEEFDYSKLPLPASSSEDEENDTEGNEDDSSEDEESDENSESDDDEDMKDEDNHNTLDKKIKNIDPKYQDADKSSTSGDSEDSEDYKERLVGKKRKVTSSSKKQLKNKKKRTELKRKQDIDSMLDTGLSLGDEEQLALHILSNTR